MPQKAVSETIADAESQLRKIHEQAFSHSNTFQEYNESLRALVRSLVAPEATPADKIKATQVLKQSILNDPPSSRFIDSIVSELDRELRRGRSVGQANIPMRTELVEISSFAREY